MAKGKSSSGKTYSSKGERRNVSGKVLSVMRKEKYEGDKMLDLQRAWSKGQNPWMTIENPNKNETNKRFIRVKMNDTSLGHPKERQKKLFQMPGA